MYNVNGVLIRFYKQIRTRLFFFNHLMTKMGVSISSPCITEIKN